MSAPVSARMQRGWSTLAAALRAALTAAGDERTVAEVLGLGGDAFRIIVGRELELGGWHASAWLHELPAMLARLGWSIDIVFAGPDDPSLPAARARARTLIDGALARGWPALAYGVHLGEWGLITGRGAGGFTVSGILDGRGGPSVLAEDELGAGEPAVLCVLALRERLPVAPGLAVRSALAAAVRHLRGGTLTDRTHDAGLAAWATLEETLESGRFDPPGLAWTFQQLSEARAAATAWLGSVRGHFGPAAAASLERAERAWGRASEALADAAARLPFPPALSSAGLTTTVVTRLLERVREAALAEFDGLRAVEAALAAAREDALALRVRDLALADAGALFACVRDLPLGDLGPATEQARKRAIPDGMRAKVLESAGSVVGHVYSSLLGSARAPLLGPEGVAAERVLVLHCPWVDRRLRGRGLGRRLIEAVIADARAQRLLGIAMIATAEEQFLGDTAMKHLGWVEVDRREDDDARLLWLALTAPGGTQPAPLPRFAAPQTLVTTASPASLPVVTVRHAYHCPLLLASRQHTARAARSAEVSLDEADAPAAGGAAGARATVRGHDLPWGWLPATASAQIIEEARRG